MTAPVRATTLEAYRRMQVEGRLSAARWKVWSFLFHSPESTRNEIDAGLAPGRSNPPYSRRLCELERMGVVERGPVRKCKVTGFSADTWFALQQLPVAPPAPPPQRGQLLQRLGQSIVIEFEDGVAEQDPVAFVRRWKSAIQELHLP